ncbi:MAG TPA: Ig domain-containing protein [Pseudonocardiaceae bacterium]|jgi:hypothetical protein|nr:Ig domain-containing protein [Pseudonocardiaceae bacterium]
MSTLWRIALAGGLIAGTLVVAAPAVTAAAPGDHAARPAATATHRILFDDTKAETAGNADWIISTSMPDPLAQNAAPTKETDWTGAISAWGVALQQTGQYSLKTLPPGNTITYGDSSNALDLSNFDEFVLPEPNIVLSSAEKAAVMHFVQNGGGLFLVSDHNGSDRNNDGWDSPAIINDLMTNNGVDNNDPFGFSVDLKDIKSDQPVAIDDPSNPVLNGAFGTVQKSEIDDGTTFTLNPSDNPNVKGLLYLSSDPNGGDTNAFFVTSTYGSGRVAIWGDSSTIDDGTGESGKSLYVGWGESGVQNAALGLNATAWLAGSGGGGSPSVSVTNPGSQTSTVGTAASLQIQASDTDGGTLSYTATGLPAGLSINSSTGLISGTPTATASSTVTVTATDSTGPSASTSFGWTVSTTGTGGCTSAQLLGNPGFETGSAAPWTASATSLVADNSKEPAHSGSWDAWLDGTGTTRTDTLSQTVSLPAGCTNYTLSYWLHIDSAEPTTKAYDTLTVQVLNSSGAVLSTVGSYSNVNAASGYTQHTVSLAGDGGQTVTLKFTGSEDYTKQTSFVVDDTALNVS